MKMKALGVTIVLCGMVSFAVCASDLEVQLVGGEDTAVQEDIDLDDLKLGAKYKIDGYATVQPISFDYYDSFAQYKEGMVGDYSHESTYDERSDLVFWDKGSWYHTSADWCDSSTNAEFAWFMMDVINLKKTEVSFIKEATVKVIYDDEYEYTGWVRQINHDYLSTVYRKAYSSGDYYKLPETDPDGRELTYFTLDPSDEQPIGQMYTGNYIFGCTLPNAVVEAKEPLSMIITLGDNELTYNIRK